MKIRSLRSRVKGAVSRQLSSPIEHFMPSPRLFAMTFALIIMMASTQSVAHTNAELCDTRQDIVMQCADAHDCITRAEVSEFIGYCKGDGETIEFAMCDQRRNNEDCATGDRCLIGTLDPHIGVCVTNPSPEPLDPPPEEPMEQELPDKDEPTCQSAPIHSPTPSHILWLGLLGGLVLGRRIRHTP